MKLININDTIFATVNFCGRIIYNVTLSGLSSIKDVMRVISGNLSEIDGIKSKLLTVTVRNGSQGWTERRSLRLSHSAAMPEGTQLTLF